MIEQDFFATSDYFFFASSTAAVFFAAAFFGFFTFPSLAAFASRRSPSGRAMGGGIDLDVLCREGHSVPSVRVVDHPHHPRFVVGFFRRTAEIFRYVLQGQSTKDAIGFGDGDGASDGVVGNLDGSNIGGNLTTTWTAMESSMAAPTGMAAWRLRSLCWSPYRRDVR